MYWKGCSVTTNICSMIPSGRQNLRHTPLLPSALPLTFAQSRQSHSHLQRRCSQRGPLFQTDLGVREQDGTDVGGSRKEKKEHIHTHNLMETSSNAKFLKNHTLSTPNPPLPQQSQFIQTARYYFKSEGYVARPFGFP